jgi:mannose-6-phosphate isomerase-like protein (cupin superfamily)
MTQRFPSAEDYSAEQARYPGLVAIDLRAHHEVVRDGYRNEVLANVNDDCLRLAVFEGEYRWHRHPDSDELFLVVEGRLQVELAGRDMVELAPWQCIVVPAGTVHRTRAIGRTVNLTFERQQAKTEFVDEVP